MTPVAAATPPSARWAALLGIGVLALCGGGWWFLARPQPVEPSTPIERYVGRWVPDWERMLGEPGTLGAARRGGGGGSDAWRAVESWKRRGLELVVDRAGEVRVLAEAEPGSPLVSRHAATVEGGQLRLRGLESGGKPLPPGYESVLRLRRDGALLLILLYGATDQRTVILRRP